MPNNMTKKEIFALVVRLFALVFAFHVTQHLVNWLPMVGQPGGMSSRLLIIIACCTAMVCMVMWVFPTLVADFISPHVAPEKNPEALTEKNVQVILITCIGIYILSYAIPDMLYWVLHIQSLKHIGGYGIKDLPSGGAGFYATLLEIAMGLFLTFGAKGVVGFIRLVRRAGNE